MLPLPRPLCVYPSVACVCVLFIVAPLSNPSLCFEFFAREDRGPRFYFTRPAVLGPRCAICSLARLLSVCVSVPASSRASILITPVALEFESHLSYPHASANIFNQLQLWIRFLTRTIAIDIETDRDHAAHACVARAPDPPPPPLNGGKQLIEIGALLD